VFFLYAQVDGRFILACTDAVVKTYEQANIYDQCLYPEGKNIPVIFFISKEMKSISQEAVSIPQEIRR
jgi:hypothetical protein